MNIQWFPGHMAKALRLVKENLKLVDIVIELLDARIPISSKNPDIDELVNSKPRIVILNKSDLADEKTTKDWIDYYKTKSIRAIAFDSNHQNNLNPVTELINSVLKDKVEAQKEKGMINRTVKAMIVGIPNVGKSSFINKFVKKSVANSGDRPGVTKGKQWIRVKQGYEILDTPGILWPKFDDNTGLNLAYIGSVRDEIIDIETLAVNLLNVLNKNYSKMLCERYKIETSPEMTGYDIMIEISKKRGFLISGGEYDTMRCANIVLDEFRASKIGRISLESPRDFDDTEE